MTPPTLDQFNLQPSDLALAERGKIAAAVLACLVSIGGLVAIGHTKLTWPLILTLPPYGTIVAYFLFKAFLRFVWPTFNRATLYQSARRAYDKWWVRTQTIFWNSLSGLRFEHELAALFRRTGMQAEVTSASGDKGVDIWLAREGQRIPVQCKAHKRPVSPGVVREFIGTMALFGSTEGVIASLSGFTQGCRGLGRGIRLMTMKDIIDMQRQLK